VMNNHSFYLSGRHALYLAMVVFFAVGVWALRLQTLQARDIVRKHDIEDIETALNRYEKTHGTFPPDDSSSWCGIISAQESKEVMTSIDSSLRQDQKYTKQEKKFPTDPIFGNTTKDYFYWKTSPVSFELLSKLESDKNGTRDTTPCGKPGIYDYSVVSFLRNKF